MNGQTFSLRLGQTESIRAWLGWVVRSSSSFLALTVVTILNRSGREEMVWREGLFWSSETVTCGNSRAVLVQSFAWWCAQHLLQICLYQHAANMHFPKFQHLQTGVSGSVMFLVNLLAPWDVLLPCGLMRWVMMKLLKPLKLMRRWLDWDSWSWMAWLRLRTLECCDTMTPVNCLSRTGFPTWLYCK